PETFDMVMPNILYFLIMKKISMEDGNRATATSGVVVLPIKIGMESSDINPTGAASTVNRNIKAISFLCLLR
ncbi:MAG: hypothetical protein FWE95_11745, partial [Planctomycetaceae bacterium]|nr:hypothetical protein [Planctomycetaceae bacterium]